MKLFHIIALCIAVLFLWVNRGHAAVEPNYVPDKPPVTTPWYAEQGEAERKADLDFIEGMRPHHAGALTMSDAYLKDAQASNSQLKQLARGIILNQQFEIAMLDRVKDFVAKPIEGGRQKRQVAERGLAQKQRFVRAPMPGPLDAKVRDVSERDVQFAKGMAIHHEAALIMAQDYLNNPAATNKYLRLMCVEILKDQKMEIAFMHKVAAQYPGDPASVKVDMSMIHGMEGMSHNGMKHHVIPESTALPASGGHGHHSGH